MDTLPAKIILEIFSQKENGFKRIHSFWKSNTEKPRHDDSICPLGFCHLNEFAAIKNPKI